MRPPWLEAHALARSQTPPATFFLCSFHSLSLILPNDTLLPPERAPFSQPCFATSGLAQDLRATCADDDALGMRENGGDCEAAGALDVHEEASRGGDESLEFVLAGLGHRRGIEEINCENHLDRFMERMSLM